MLSNMQIFERDLSGYKNEFMNAKEAFEDVYDATKDRLKASVSKQELHNFMDSYAGLEAALPNKLKNNIRTLPTTDNALLLSGIPTENANFIRLEHGEEKKYNFPLCALAAYACNTHPTNKFKILGGYLRNATDLAWHFDNSGEPYLLGLLGINKGKEPAATKLLCLSTALQNPEFVRIVSNNKYFAETLEKHPQHFGELCGKKRHNILRHSVVSPITPPIDPTFARILEEGEALLFFNPNSMHGRMDPKATQDMFPEAKGSSGDRKLMRHLLPLSPTESPLLNALNAARERCNAR